MFGGSVGIAIFDGSSMAVCFGTVGVAGDGAEGALVEVAPDWLFSATDEVAGCAGDRRGR